MTKTSYEAVKDWRYNCKRKLYEAFGSRCGSCGLQDELVCYDFHHLDQSQKDFQISEKIRSWTKVSEEARKCCMLCAHCHRKVHAGFIDLPADILKFDETRISRAVTHDTCPVCSKEKLIKQVVCSSKCSATHRSKVAWDDIDLGELWEKYRTATAISRVLGVSDVAVRRRLKMAMIIG